MKLTDKIEITNEDNMELMKRYPDNYFDLAIVDAPYGIDGNSHRNNLSRNKFTKAKKYHNALWDQEVPTDEYWEELFRVSKDQIIWGINYFQHPLLTSAGRIVWDKCNGENNFSDAEIAYCSMFYSVRMVHYMWNGMMQGETIGRESSRLQGKKSLNEQRIHPTQKPELLYRWILTQKWCSGKRKILDTHLGSGSIAITCHKIGLELTACEIDEKYYNDAIKRIKARIDAPDLYDLIREAENEDN